MQYQVKYEHIVHPQKLKKVKVSDCRIKQYSTIIVD